MKQFTEETGGVAFRRSLMQIGDLLRIVTGKGADSRRMSRITVSQARIFGYVFDHAEDGAIRLKQLAHDLDVSPAAASQAVDRLVRAGLVSRTADPTDRRAVSISFSSKGRKLYEQFDGKVDATIAEALNDVPKAEKEVFFKVMSRLHARMVEKWLAILAERDAAK